MRYRRIENGVKQLLVQQNEVGKGGRIRGGMSIFPIHLPLCLQLNSRFLGMDDAPFEDSTVYLNDAIGKIRLVG